MKLVYVAAPFRADSPWLVEQNIRLAEQWGLEVARNDCTPVIPHTMYRFFDNSLPDEFWIEATADLLRKCDAVLFVGNWQKSSGCRAEHALAEQEGIQIVYAGESHPELGAWARIWETEFTGL